MRAASVLVLAIIGVTLVVAEAHQGQSRLANANGTGTLRVGREQFKITSVVVKLMDDRKAEITLVSDITVFLSGKWSGAADQQGIDLQITGGATGGGLEGTGKILLSDDAKSVVRLNIKGVSRTTKLTLEANFEGK
jgi:hypothetical protein